MAGNGRFLDLLGTVYDNFRIGIGTTVVRLKNVAGVLEIRNKADSADAALVASKLSASGDVIELNEDSAGSGDDWKLTLARAATGMTEDYTFTFPIDGGSPSQFLQTDGDGNTSWATIGGSTDKVGLEVTALAFGSATPVAMFTLPANAYISLIEVNVDTAFDGTAPTASIGIAGTTSKYVAATQIDLKTVGQYIIGPGQIPVGATEDLIITYSADSSTAGAARVIVHYAIPA